MARLAPGLGRGQVWWARLRSPRGTRPVVLVSRAAAYGRRNRLTVAPVTRRIRGIPTEVRLGLAEGLRVDCVASCDELETIPQAVLIERVGKLSAVKVAALDRSLRFALGLD